MTKDEEKNDRRGWPEESTPSTEQESQEDLWVKVMVESEYIESEGIWKVIERLKTQFTITRKK